jgi:Ca-activated chloride channel family protein
MNTAMQMNPHSPESTGARLVTADGRTLPLRGAVLRADARGGIARVVLEQRFANPYGEPLSVTYLMPLPADGAVSGYAFTIGARRVIGEVDRRAAARERYEEAIASGRSAAIVEQERSSLFTQEIGNIPPGVEITAELTIDQKLLWLDEGAWEWRFPTVAMPRYQGGPGRVPDVQRVTVDVADAPMTPRVTLALTVRDVISAGRQAESPSHQLSRDGDGTIFLASDGGVRLDRDVVVRWPVAQAVPGVTLDVARPGLDKPHHTQAYGLVTLVPPAIHTRMARSVARDLCLLIDTSGSMGGEPLDQARRVLNALVDTLGDGDTLEMIEFSNRPRRWKKEPVKATAGNRNDARKWLRELQASGGTEMRAGLMEALAPLRAESQRQIVLVSDGAIGFESEIVADIINKLPAGSRVHTVGVGSGVNRSLTQPAARAGRGVEVLIGIGEDPERAARRICARTAEPLLVDVQLSGSALVSCAPARLPDLFSGAPALVSVALRPEGGELVMRGRSADGEWLERLPVAPVAAGQGNGAVTALYGREHVEDLEMRRCAAGENGAELDGRIERVGVEFQIATRLTSWLAIDSERAVDPTRPSRRESIPQELPYGVSVEGLGLRACAAPVALEKGSFTGRVTPAAPASAMPQMRTRGMAPAAKAAGGAAGAIGAALGKLGGLFKKESGDGGGGGGVKDASEAAKPIQPEARRTMALPSAPRDEEAADADDTRVAAPKPPLGERHAEQAEIAPLRGRIVKLDGREIIVQIDVPDDFAWSLDGEAWIEDDAGGHTRARVDGKRSTGAQPVKRGQSLRLVLELDAPLPGRPTLITCGPWRIEV